MYCQTRVPVWVSIFIGSVTFLIWYYASLRQSNIQNYVKTLKVLEVQNFTPISQFATTDIPKNLSATTKPVRRNHTSRAEFVMDLVDNYFEKALQKSQGVMLIDTPKCKIPSFNPFDQEIVALMEPREPRCKENIKITYVDYQNVVINETELEIRGHNFEDITCCYRTIWRVEQKLSDYSWNADNGIRYSDKCFPMNLTTEPKSGYIVVNCTKPAENETQKIIYENVHALAKLSSREERKLLRRLAFWENQSESSENLDISMTLPPNVLLLGIDSTSRLNFHRFMRRTKRLLEKIGANEMLGYTKMGENTCPSFYGFLNNYSFKDIEENCAVGNSNALDNSTFLWTYFSNHNYITGHFEDAPKLTGFNYGKTGFVHAPTDLYYRAWMYAAYKEHGKDKEAPFTIECLGYQRPEEMGLIYIRDLVTHLHSRKAPYFITTWFTDLTHEDINQLQTLDDLLFDIIKSMYENDLFSNTLLLVMSDHGYRWGSIRETTSGWFEDKLPFMYIRLPETLQKQFPEWQEALEYNSKELTSPFDLHETFMDILKLTNSSQDYNNGTSLLRGSSLFKKLPSRNCADAYIPAEYCACLPNLNASVDISVIQFCVEEIMNKINKDLPRDCAQLKATKVTSAVIVNTIKNETVSITDYSITFEALPTEFKFEAIATYDENTGEIIDIPHVQRTNKKTQDTSCLAKEESHLELFCTCT